MGKSTLSSFDSKAWKRSRPLVTEIQGLTEMSGVLLSLDVFSEPPTYLPTYLPRLVNLVKEFGTLYHCTCKP